MNVRGAHAPLTAHLSSAIGRTISVSSHRCKVAGEISRTISKEKRTNNYLFFPYRRHRTCRCTAVRLIEILIVTVQLQMSRFISSTSFCGAFMKTLKSNLTENCNPSIFMVLTVQHKYFYVYL